VYFTPNCTICHPHSAKFSKKVEKIILAPVFVAFGGISFVEKSAFRPTKAKSSCIFFHLWDILIMLHILPLSGRIPVKIPEKRHNR